MDKGPEFVMELMLEAPYEEPATGEFFSIFLFTRYITWPMR